MHKGFTASSIPIEMCGAALHQIQLKILIFCFNWISVRRTHIAFRSTRQSEIDFSDTKWKRCNWQCDRLELRPVDDEYLCTIHKRFSVLFCRRAENKWFLTNVYSLHTREPTARCVSPCFCCTRVLCSFFSSIRVHSFDISFIYGFRLVCVRASAVTERGNGSCAAKTCTERSRNSQWIRSHTCTIARGEIGPTSHIHVPHNSGSASWLSVSTTKEEYMGKDEDNFRIDSLRISFEF